MYYSLWFVVTTKKEKKKKRIHFRIFYTLVGCSNNRALCALFRMWQLIRFPTISALGIPDHPQNISQFIPQAPFITDNSHHPLSYKNLHHTSCISKQKPNEEHE